MAVLAVVLLLAALAAAHPHPEYELLPPGTPMPERPTHRIVGGSGNYTFQYDPSKLVLPAGVKMLNGHGLAKDAAGNIYFTYESTEKDETAHALIRFDPNGENGVLLGNSTLAMGTPHGLRIKDNALYHANNNAIVTKTDLDGNILWRFDMTANWTGTKFWPFRPTDSVSPPGVDRVYVADGYGLSYVHEFSDETGAYTGNSFGGKGTSTNPQQFNCNHGINWDPRNQSLLVSDRGNSRLQWVTLDGQHLRGVDMSAASPLSASGTQPCNVDINLDVYGGAALIPGLDGPVGIIDPTTTTVLSVIEVGTLLKQQCPHPHDAIVLLNGDLVVCCWNPGFISYWKRISQ